MISQGSIPHEVFSYNGLCTLIGKNKSIKEDIFNTVIIALSALSVGVGCFCVRCVCRVHAQSTLGLVLGTHSSSLCDVADGHVSGHILALQQSLQDVSSLVLTRRLFAQTVQSNS